MYQRRVCQHLFCLIVSTYREQLIMGTGREQPPTLVVGHSRSARSSLPTRYRIERTQVAVDVSI